jgi:hypothetical protein
VNLEPWNPGTLEPWNPGTLAWFYAMKLEAGFLKLEIFF